jgi:hypothetical protein
MDNIEFVTLIDGLDQIDECLPKPAKHFIPDWFKNIPHTVDSTVRSCPSFPDFFSQGYILPMWTDTRISYDSETTNYSWETSMKDTALEVHNNLQFVDHATPYMNGSEGKFIFKAVCPWKIITPPGWSVLQLPLFYHFNEQWSVLPGVLDTDIYHSIHQQILYHGNGETVEIECGDPLVLYVPFKRSDKVNLQTRSATEEDKKRFELVDLRISSKFTDSGAYRKMQRDRDKSNG